MLRDSLTYPIRDGGWITILIGAIFVLILDFFQMAPLFGLAVGIFAAGYFGSFYLSIVGSTMTDGDRIPDWPSFSDFFDDIVHPFLRLLGLIILSFWPVLVVGIFVDEDAEYFLPSIIAAVSWGCIYFPMAVLAASAFGGILSALPHIVLPAVVRAMPIYLMAVIALVVVFFSSGFAQEYAVRIPFAGWFIAASISLYALMFQARLIGLVYRDKRDSLGWD